MQYKYCEILKKNLPQCNLDDQRKCCDCCDTGQNILSDINTVLPDSAHYGREWRVESRE